MRISTLTLLLGFSVVCNRPTLEAQQEATASPPVVTEERFSDVARREAESYRFLDGEGHDADFDFHAEPLLRYTNPVSGSSNGHVFIWTKASRPQTIAAIFQFPGRALSTEFHSLSLDGFSAERDDGEKWTPPTPGVKFQSVPGVGSPAESARTRLIQMRSIARRFTADRTEPDGEQYPLRLLPNPLYRYGNDEASVFDGGVFAYVQGTNPDVLLLLEARRDDSGVDRWEYAFARLHHRTMRAVLNDKTVWNVSRLTNAQKEERDRVYGIFRRNVNPPPKR